jgi:hypothetical protein
MDLQELYLRLQRSYSFLQIRDLLLKQCDYFLKIAHKGPPRRVHRTLIIDFSAETGGLLSETLVIRDMTDEPFTGKDRLRILVLVRSRSVCL